MAQTPSVASACCRRTEQTLAAVAGGLYPAFKEQSTFGMAKAVEDSMAAAGTTVMATAGLTRPGDPACADREVAVKFEIPTCDAVDTCTTNIATDCPSVAETVEQYGYDKTTVDQCVEASFAIMMSDFDCNCEDPMVDLAMKMRIAFRKMYKGYNDKLIELAYSSMGNYFTLDGDTPVSSIVAPKVLKVFTTNAKPQPMGFFPAVEEYLRQDPEGASRPYMVSGSAKLRAYEYSTDIFAGNLDGFDANKLAQQFVGYTDYNVDPTIAGLGGLTTENMLTWLPGAMHIVDWALFDTERRTVDSNGRTIWAAVQASGNIVRQRMDIGSAFGGRPFIVDALISFEECSNKVSWVFQKYFDLWCIPQEAFSAACDQAHNYKTLWTADCSDVLCTDLC